MLGWDLAFPAVVPRSLPMRSFISLAALFVKVMAKIWLGSMPDRIIQATRWVKALVFPEPGPDMTKTGPSTVLTASICLSFNPLRIFSFIAVLVYHEIGRIK